MADPYATLGITPAASDREIRAAYRRLVQLRHPDHNRGSAESARRFEEVQAAYTEVIRRRRAGAPGPAQGPGPAQASGPAHAPVDPSLDAHLADLERQVREAHLARERARQAAREAAAHAQTHTERPATDEELGYVTTDDSFSKVLADALDEIAARLRGEGR